MDIISYGAASAASNKVKELKNNVLGTGVSGAFANIKDRIDSMEIAMDAVNQRANNLIIQDAINIMKAHAKLNAIAKTMKYKMANMVFDDLLDLSGIDTTKSSGYTHDAANGLLKSSGGTYTIQTKADVANAIPARAVLTVETVIPGTTTPSAKITNDATLTKIGNPNGFSASGLRDGDINNYVWDDSSVNELQGIKADFGAQKTFGTIKVYGHNVYPMRGLRVTVDGVEVANTTTNVTSAAPLIVNLPAGTKGTYIEILRKDGTYTFDQTMSEIEIWDAGASTPDTPTTLGTYQVSCDDGVTWEPITPDTLFTFAKPTDKKIRIKADLPSTVQLLNYALTWV